MNYTRNVMSCLFQRTKRLTQTDINHTKYLFSRRGRACLCFGLNPIIMNKQHQQRCITSSLSDRTLVVNDVPSQFTYCKRRASMQFPSLFFFQRTYCTSPQLPASSKLLTGRSFPPGHSVSLRRISTQKENNKFTLQNPVYTSYLQSLVEELQSLQDEQHQNQGTESKRMKDGHQRFSRITFLHTAVSVIERLQAKHKEMLELLQMLHDEQDAEMRKLIESEKAAYKKDIQDIEEELTHALVGTDPADDSDIRLEVTAGVGGQEAMLFCLEVFNMYCNYAMRRGWRLEELAAEDSEMGGARRASVEISGDGIYGHLKHEGGVHRVQRVPRTEKAGRMHTSTITVSVMPLPKEIDIQLDQKDLKVETFRNSGPGGQSVNTTDSAVRITHIPTGTVAEGKEERSQIKNKDIALKKLRQEMYEERLNAQQAEIRASRKLQEGTRSRSEKIRTYNFQQDRVTDHRTRENMSNLTQLLSVGGDGLDELIDGLKEQEKMETLDMMLDGWERSGNDRRATKR